MHTFYERLHDKRSCGENFFEFFYDIRWHRPVKQEGVMRIGADDGLDDDPVALMRIELSRQRIRVESLAPEARHDRHTSRFEIAQIGLGYGPAHERYVIDEYRVRRIDGFQQG